jgi:hypothetical protein
LRQEGIDPRLVLLEQGADLLGSVGPHCAGRSHHQSRLLYHLVVRGLLQKRTREVSSCSCSRTEDEDQDQIEFEQEAHRPHIIAWTTY